MKIDKIDSCNLQVSCPVADSQNHLTNSIIYGTILEVKTKKKRGDGNSFG
jgi:flavin reductase (DIM6/NTAB) family NADH-FMN oxidoreductase RutF